MIIERLLASLQNRYHTAAVPWPRQGHLSGTHAMQEMTSLHFEGLLEIDSWKQYVSCPMQQLIIVHEVVVHALSSPGHAINSFVQHRDLVINDVVVHNHLTIPDHGYFPSFAGI
jgi:hypothetical protein